MTRLAGIHRGPASVSSEVDSALAQQRQAPDPTPPRASGTYVRASVHDAAVLDAFREAVDAERAFEASIGHGIEAATSARFATRRRLMDLVLDVANGVVARRA